MKKLFRDNGLTIALFTAFLVFQVLLSWVGLAQYNEERVDHHKPVIAYAAYVRSSQFLETTMENWESEFLQMFAYILLTAYLYQRGSAESKDPDAVEGVDADPRLAPYSDRLPWPVRKGGIVLKLYENSLGLAFLLLFLLSFWLHAWAGAQAFSETQIDHGGAPVTTLQYFCEAQFWFESLQNWQSEFFSIGLMVILSVYLRQRGSPESKPVAAFHADYK